MTFRALYPLLFVFAAAAVVRAAAETPDASKQINPERPGFTNGIETVEPRRLQLELGYLWEQDAESRQSRVGDQSELRLGLSPRAEMRFGLPVYVTLRPRAGSDMDRVSGWEDAAASVKWRLLDSASHRPGLAVIAGTSLPSGSGGLREDAFQPQVALEAGWDAGALWHLEADAVWTDASEGKQRYSQFAGGFNVGYNLGAKASVFAETYCIAPMERGSSASAFIDGGVQYALSPDLQIDVTTGFGITRGVRQDHFFGMGISERW